jgi:hypothetical protein
MDQQVQKTSRGVRSAERPSGNSIRSNAEASAGETASRRTLIHESVGATSSALTDATSSGTGRSRRGDPARPNADLLDALPEGELLLEDLPEDVARRRFEALRLEVHYNKYANPLKCRGVPPAGLAKDENRTD